MTDREKIDEIVRDLFESGGPLTPDIAKKMLRKTKKRTHVPCPALEAEHQRLIKLWNKP